MLDIIFAVTGNVDNCGYQLVVTVGDVDDADTHSVSDSLGVVAHNGNFLRHLCQLCSYIRIIGAFGRGFEDNSTRKGFLGKGGDGTENHEQSHQKGDSFFHCIWFLKVIY